MSWEIKRIMIMRECLPIQQHPSFPHQYQARQHRKRNQLVSEQRMTPIL